MTKEKLTVNELFSGIGAQRKAFERLGIPHEVVGISEIDKYAIQSYEAIFGKTKNYGDISTAPRLDYADLWTYSFPCQDISVAGNQKGISEGTRSGLLYQVQRLLEVAKIEGTLPKYLLLENVKNLVGKKFKSQFDNWLFYLDQLGYDTYWQVLNAKNYGIPQNRERVFAISIRKDLGQTFEFPKAEPLTKKLADMLENEVDEKFYLSEDKILALIKNIENSDFVAIKEATKKGYAQAAVGDSINIEQPNSKTRRGRVGRGVAQTLTTAPQQVVLKKEKIVCEQRHDEGLRFFKDYAIGTLRTIDACGDKRVIELPCIGASRGRNPENPSDRTVGTPVQQRLELNIQGTSKTITTVQKDNYIVENRIIQVGNYRKTDSFGGNPQCGRVYDVEGISPTLSTMQGGDRQPKIIEAGYCPYSNSNKQHQSNTVYSPEGIAPTLTAVDYKSPIKIINDIRIRKLTPLECWRLMGFDDEDFKKAEVSGVSNTQLYKQAGNSIVVNVLEKIFENLYRK